MNRVFLPVAVVLGAPSLLLVDSAIKSGLILLLAALVALALRRDSAATRHLVWLVAIVAVLVVPVFSAMLPQWRVLPAWAVISHESPAVELPAPAVAMPEQADVRVPSAAVPIESELPFLTDDQPIAEVAVSQPAFVASEVTASEVTASELDTNVTPEPIGPSWNWTNALPLVWAIGFCVLILRLMAARMMLWSNERRATVIALSPHSNGGNGGAAEEFDDSIVAAFEAAYRQLRVRQRVSLLIHSERTIPVVWGIIRFRLLLPVAARQWSGEQLRSVLLHELAHINRRDTIVQLLGQVACALHWFNPLVWFAAWRLCVERERACDDLVLANGVPASAYAEHLLNVTTRLSSSPWTQACGLAMAHSSSLDGRVRAILSANHNRRNVTATFAAIALLLGASIVIPVAMLRAAEESPAGEATPASQPDEESSTTNGTKLRAKTEAILQWGKPVNGLRAALSRLPSLGEPKNGHYMDFDLVVQNVSKAAIRLTGNSAAPDHRTVAVREDGSTLFRIVSKEPSEVDVLLQPREVAVLRVFPDNETEKGKPLAENPDLTFYGMMEIKTAPDGAWTGKLITPDVSGAVVSGKQPAKDNNAATDESKPKPGTTLEAGIEQKLKWGEPVNGLRAAVMIRRVGDMPNDLFVVVQNVSRREIRLNGTTAANKRTLYIKRHGKIQQGLGTQEPRFGEVLLQPREVTLVRMFPAELIRSDSSMGAIVAESALKDSPWTMYVEIDFTNVPPGVWKGKLVTAETNGAEAAVFRGQDHSKPASGEKLEAGIEQKLKWGEPVNGLRAAVMIRRVGDKPPDLFVVVQNVSKTEIHINDSAARNEHTLYIKLNGELETAMSGPEPRFGNRLLQPRDVATIPVLPPKPKPDPRLTRLTAGQMMAANALADAQWTMYVEVVFENVPAGTWKAKLVTAETSGAEAAIGYPVPKHKTARALFKQWQANARLNEKIPGGRLGSLRKATSKFVEYNPTHEAAPKLKELLKRMDVTRDWTQQEAVDLLNDVTDVYDNLPRWAADLQRFTIGDDLRIGQPLPDDLKDAPWGDAQPNGLRVAWLLDPQSEEHRLNTPLKSRLLYHNTGKEAVVFRVVTWNQSGAHKAQDAAGKDIEILATSWTTIGQVIACRLQPGEFTEVIGAGIGIGPNINQEDWRNTRVGAWIHAKAGDEVTFTPDAITASGADGRQQDVTDAEWWSSFITQRLERDAPFPDDANERKRLLARAMVDLFGRRPTPEEFATFLADKSPEALNALAKRLVQREGTAATSGKLRSGTTTFRVLPIDPDAKNKPRLAIGPGRYELGNNARLVIVGRGHVMDANLEFSGDDASAKSHEIKLPNKLRTWAIAWKRDVTTLWIAEEGKLRSVDFTRPAEVTETQIDPADTSKVPPRFLKALRPTFERKPQPLTLPPLNDPR